jgi:hypothetical protein
MNTYAIDYETFFSDDYSIKDLGNWAYTHHKEFDAYMLSVAGINGYRWVGNPRDFDWNILQGQELIAHNAGFELAVTERLRELGIVPANFTYAGLYDTADLTAYLGYPRSLENAALYLLDKKIEKGIRNWMKNKRYEDIGPEKQKELQTYGLTDSVTELEIWVKHNHKWPQHERELSAETRAMCWRGLPTDVEKVNKAIEVLETKLLHARTIIPWAKEPDAKILSLPRAAQEARKHGIAPPKSFAKDSEEFEQWVAQYGDKFPWAMALGEYRSANRLSQTFQTLQKRTDESGIFRFGLKYGGAHTIRDSGDSGFNVQNPPKVSLHGVDLRGAMLTAPKGYVLGIADENAIEPRVLSCLSGDDKLRAMLASGMDPYEAQARIAHGYTDERPLKEVDPVRRQYMKVEVLGLGYGAGADKTIIIAKNMAGLTITKQEAERVVEGFRSRKFIPAFWARLEKDCRNSAPGDYEMELPSGRVMNYRNVRSFGSISAEIPRLDKMMRVKLWGGALTENACQAVGRDIFMWHIMEVKKQLGLSACLRAHDEGVWLLKEDTAEQDLENILSIMRTAPPWMPDFPAAAEGALKKQYCKI